MNKLPVPPQTFAEPTRTYARHSRKQSLCLPAIKQISGGEMQVARNTTNSDPLRAWLERHAPRCHQMANKERTVCSTSHRQPKRSTTRSSRSARRTDGSSEADSIGKMIHGSKSIHTSSPALQQSKTSPTSSQTATGRYAKACSSATLPSSSRSTVATNGGR